VVANASVNFAIILGLFTLFLLISGTFSGWVYFAIFPLLALHILFAIGLGITFGVLNVFFRDVGKAMGVILWFWFWLTPIVYPITVLPESGQAMMAYNPMMHLIGAYQDILARGVMPDWSSLWSIAALAVFFCIIGLRLFRKHAGDMVDEL
jgi:lipopolysaccharide transport system permease protein